MWQGDRQIVTDILVAKMSGFSPTEYTEDTGAKIKDGVFLKRDTHGMYLYHIFWNKWLITKL